MRDYTELHERLEREGKFDTYTTPTNTKLVVPVGDDYVYLPRNPFKRLFSAFCIFIVFLFGPILNIILYGLRVRGRKNLRGIKRAVTVSNHVLYLDYLVNKQAFRFHRLYVTAAEHNNKKGLGGAIIRGGKLLPLGGTLKAQMNFIKTVKYLLSHNNYVHFYSEHSMWLRYEKPRPLQKGAFQFAADCSVPVIPALICFRKPRGLEKLFYRRMLATIQICKPIYPKEGFTKKENTEYLLDATEASMDQVYLAFYGKENDILKRYKNKAAD